MSCWPCESTYASAKFCYIREIHDANSLSEKLYEYLKVIKSNEDVGAFHGNLPHVANIDNNSTIPQVSVAMQQQVNTWQA
jgi:hypothetical protein